ncbi:alkaline phosphatase D [Micromonospora pisi]|uniref:Alkaline phosphatase D n=1 Tax=Micromonospora pisi TaxID=589240 RepID=A0A495JV80_9ACTN|nr:alkaline phosphatase D family protein [Micromonospora pisi]RKR92936.1 alkaline phosphatase D [Micromonospora pisi]
MNDPDSHVTLSRMSRRNVLALGGFGTAAAVVGGVLGGTRPAAATPSFFDNPFRLGVASGDPLPDGVVLWTRLAPDPLAEDGRGGMPPESFGVRYEVAEDERFARIVRRGAVEATPEFGHSVHIEVSGLKPGREYFYRFRVGPAISPVGRTKTAPALDAAMSRLKLAVTSCQNYPAGYFVAYRDIVASDLDVVVHLGDYIYQGPSAGDASLGRAHVPPVEITTLAEYRIRHAQYKTDPDLQAAHSMLPFIVVPDDHEVTNNYADEVGPDGPAFPARRAAAYQAYYENMPLRRASIPVGPDMRLYRRVRFGDLAQFHMLDTRQYRSDQAKWTAATAVGGYAPGALDPNRTILGDAQEQWLQEGLATSTTRWNVIGNQTKFAPFDHKTGPGLQYDSPDNWGEGYVADRDQLLRFIAAHRPSNPVVITGDAHRNWVFNLKADFADPSSETLATEYLGTSISSGGDGNGSTVYGPTADNPHMMFQNNQRGYIRVEVTPEQWRADFRVSDTVLTRDTPLYTVATFVTDDGKPGARRV